MSEKTMLVRKFVASEAGMQVRDALVDHSGGDIYRAEELLGIALAQAEVLAPAAVPVRGLKGKAARRAIKACVKKLNRTCKTIGQG